MFLARASSLCCPVSRWNSDAADSVASGDTRFGMFLDGITMWTLIAVGYLAFQMELPPLLIFLILKLDECIKTPIVLLRYRKEKWLKNITK